MQAMSSNMTGQFRVKSVFALISLYENRTNINAFLSDIKLLLDNDKRSHASDHLTGFLFELNSRPVGISLPRLRTTSTVDEIVSFLEKALQIDNEIAVEGANSETRTFDSELRSIPTKKKGPLSSLFQQRLVPQVRRKPVKNAFSLKRKSSILS